MTAKKNKEEKTISRDLIEIQPSKQMLTGFWWIFQKFDCFFLGFAGRIILSQKLVSNILQLFVFQIWWQGNLETLVTQHTHPSYFDTYPPNFLHQGVAFNHDYQNLSIITLEHDKKSISVAFIGSSFRSLAGSRGWR